MSARLNPGSAASTSRAYLHCLATSISLTLFLVLVRFKVLGFPVRQTLISAFLPKAVLTGYHDVLYVIVLTLFFGALLLLWPGKGTLVNKAFRWAAVLSLLAALANIRMVQMLGTPFNYQWLYYADFLHSSDALSAAIAGLSVPQAIKSAIVCTVMSAAMLGLAWGVYALLYRLNRPFRRYAPVVLLAGWAVYLPLARHYLATESFNAHKLANPVSAFVSSVATSLVSAPDLYTRTVPAHLNEFLEAEPAAVNLVRSSGTPKIRNVLFFVLESVPAEYVGNTKFTPQLARYLPEAGTFSNIYSHCPSTHNSMIAMLTSSYPWISYKSITNEYPSIKLPSLSEELKKQSFRTAFMHSSDNRFQRMGEFLKYRGFDALEDFNTIRCSKSAQQFKPDEGIHLNGVDDACLVESFTGWLDKSDTTRPFFAMLWTMQTHFPYFLSAPEKNLGATDPYQNRYLNALRHSDAVLGNLLDELKRKGLYESTLVVVVGDHGEAFNDHSQYGHGNAIYEENVHVPLILINPRLFKGEKLNTIGGHIDVAPTIMEMLGFRSPDEWEGRSLFDARRKERTYFFAPWTDFKFGYREGPYKIIYNATLNTIEVFNLDVDPQESRNIAGQVPELVERSYDRLAAWVQYQDKHFKATLGKSGLKQ